MNESYSIHPDSSSSEFQLDIEKFRNRKSLNTDQIPEELIKPEGVKFRSGFDKLLIVLGIRKWP
jgi:hypothetical protein